ncbi:MAG: thioredoxin-dependent thiol peroxidase [Gammaproteobacteria bacterium]|jgi:peroxiredoxin Q/BCP|nr:thioredoxin-dependent thiol peroxidase [Gammaproteobacteria bacterium]
MSDYQTLTALKPILTAIEAVGDFNFADLKGKKVIIYFYPKDNTPGCTCEGENFRDAYKKFFKENTVILGVSRDSIKSHQKFQSQFEFPFALLSDSDEALCTAFGVIKDKTMYGKPVRGIERSTFLYDEKGKLVKEWRKVKVEGHVAEVLVAVKAE